MIRPRLTTKNRVSTPLLLVTLLLGCAVPEAGVAVAAESFRFLLRRYDGNSDGVIERSEYGRGMQAFSRLDTDGSGRLTAADFEREGRRVRSSSIASARSLQTRHLVGWYLQGDQDPTSISVGESVLALREFEVDGDGAIGRSEFERLANSRRLLGKRPAGRHWGLIEAEVTDPWQTLVDSIDTARDGFLDVDELQDYFDGVPAGAWAFLREQPAMPVAQFAERAPDFTLPRLGDCGAIGLSSFEGEQPVALIFGSYT